MKSLKDKRGAHRTESLFVETIQPHVARKYEPIYSLRDYDHKGYPSAYNVYMNAVDERDAALQLVGSMAHWRKLCKLKWFVEGRLEYQFEGLNQWRLDMKDRDASDAKKIIMEQTKEGNVTAAKALLAEAKGDKPKKTKGKLVKAVSKEVEVADSFLEAWEKK